MKDSIVAVWNKLRDVTTNVFNGIKEKASEIWANIKDYIIGVVKNVLERFSTVRSQMIEVGKDIARGIIDGLLNIRGWFVDRLTKWVNDNIPAVIRKVLQISSPSKVMAEIGSNMVQGLNQGLNTVSPSAIPSSTKASSPVNITINAGLGTNPYELGREVSNAIAKYGKVSAYAV
jgi:phage-related protein